MKLRACLALQNRLQLKPCQTVHFGAAPGKEPHLKPLPTSTGEVESRLHHETWLQAAPLVDTNTRSCFAKCFQNGSNSKDEFAYIHFIFSNSTQKIYL